MGHRERTIAEIYAACDEEFGAQYRTEATDLADNLVVNYEVDRPKTAVQGFGLMRKAYGEIVARHEAEKKNAPADTGPRNLSVTDLDDSDEFRPGTLDQVAADVAQRRQAGTWRGISDAEP